MIDAGGDELRLILGVVIMIIRERMRHRIVILRMTQDDLLSDGRRKRLI